MRLSSRISFTQTGLITMRFERGERATVGAGARPELLLGEYLIYEVPGAKAKVSTLLYGVFHVTEK